MSREIDRREVADNWPKMVPEQRRKIARLGANARWHKASAQAASKTEAVEPIVLPANICEGLMAFEDAYRPPNAPIETRHLDLYSGYCAEIKFEHAPLVTERMIRESTLTGSAEEIQVRVRKMAAADVN